MDLKIAIKGLQPAFPVWLAPMAGVTDSPFRQLARELGCPLLVSEMVSVEGILRGTKNTLRLLRFHPAEKPIFVQLFGASPERMAQAAEFCLGLGFDGIDINMGCPMRKVVGRGAGAALLARPDLACRMVAAVRARVSAPLSVKVRSGWSRQSVNILELGPRLADAGADLIILHPRTREQFFQGEADWSLVEKLAERVGIPVVGNGDIHTPEQALSRLRQSGCRGVMIGRAAMGAPWLPGQIATALAGGQPEEFTPERRREIALRHLEKTLAWLGDEKLALRLMRKHFLWYSRGLAGAADFRRSLATINDVEKIKQAWHKLLAAAAG
jgi:tRNA-dihydrouridine synthase B